MTKKLIKKTGNKSLSIDVQRLDRNPVVVYIGRLPSKRSQRSMHDALKRLCRVLGQDVPPENVPWWEFEYQHVARMRAMLIEAVEKHTWSPSTVNQSLSAYRGVVKEAWRLGYLDHDTAARLRDIEVIKATRLPAGRALAREEIATLLKTCRRDRRPIGKRDVAMLGILIGGGLRRSEIVGLDHGSVTPDGLKVHGKGNKERLVPLPSRVLELLQPWLDICQSDAGPLFVSCTMAGKVPLQQQRLSDQAVLHMLVRRGAQAGLEHFSPHDLRRTYISTMLEDGHDLATVSHLVGHAKTDTTRGYDRRPLEKRKEAVETLNRLFNDE